VDAERMGAGENSKIPEYLQIREKVRKKTGVDAGSIREPFREGGSKNGIITEASENEKAKGRGAIPN